MHYLSFITAFLAATASPALAIVNGTSALRDSYEYTVALIQPGLAGARQPFICNGVLISEYSVITSAECVQGLRPADVAVRVGFNNTGGYKTINVNDIATMGGFSYSSLSDDAAILNLTQAVTNITPAVLATTRIDGQYPSGNVKLVGWGGHVLNNTQSGYQSISPTLQTATVGVINAGACSRALSGCNFTLDRTQRFCTTSTSRGAEGYGDAGGAVVDGQGVVVGIMTGNPACAQTNKLAIQLLVSNAEVQQFVTDNKYGPA